MAWAKLLFLRDYGPTEVGGFAISARDDPFAIEEVRLVKQICTAISVCFDDVSVADFFDKQVDSGLRPEHFARIWVHTHPGENAHPSQVDETTFGRVFATADWAVMFILASEGQSYARLQFNIGPKGCLLVPVEVNFRLPFPAADHAAWEKEYLAHVDVPPMPFGALTESTDEAQVDGCRHQLIARQAPPRSDDADWDSWRRSMDDLNNLEEQLPW